MKKLISLMLCIVMVSCSFAAFAAEDTTTQAIDVLLESKISLLTTLGVFDEGFDAVDYTSEVSRLEFSKYLANLIGAGDKKLTDDKFFIDTDADYVNNLVVLGIVGGTGGGRFNPERKVSAGEAAIMALRALGYEEYVRALGGRTQEYMLVAKRVQLSITADGNAFLSLEQVIDFLYDLIDINVMLEQSVKVDGDGSVVGYSDESSVKLLEYYRQIVLIRGQLTGSHLASIGDADNIAADQIAIDSRLYECGDSDAYRLIGQNVICIYQKDEEKITSVLPDMKKMEVLTLLADDVVDYNNFTLKYQRAQDSREHTITFDYRKLNVIYNGKVAAYNFEQLFEIDLGTISLYAIDGTSNYTVAVIEEYVDVLVELSSTLNKTVYTNNTGNLKELDFSQTDGDGIYKRIISQSSGLTVAAKSVLAGDILSVCCSLDKEYIVAYLCNDIVDGEISAMRTVNNEKRLIISDVEYGVSPHYTGDLELKIGINGRFLLDKFGYITYAQNGSRSNDVAFLYGINNEDEAFSSSIQILLYTTSKEHIVYELSDNVNFNGVSTPKLQVMQSLTPDGILSKGLIKYSANSKGKVTMLDTGHGDTYFKELTNGVENLLIDDRSIDGKYVMTLGTTVFLVPSLTGSNAPENFNCMGFTNQKIIFNTTGENVRVYQDNADPFVEYVVCFYDENRVAPAGSRSLHMMVEEVVTEADGNGDMVTKINGYVDMLPYSVTVADDLVVNPYSGVTDMGLEIVEEGDWIMCTTNAIGEVGYIRIQYNADRDPLNKLYPYWGPIGAYGFHDSWGIVVSYEYRDWDILKVERGLENGTQALLVLGEKDTGEVRDILVVDESLFKFMVYDSTARTNKIYQGTMDDLVSLEDTNGTSCDRISYELRSSSILMNAAVYK